MPNFNEFREMVSKVDWLNDDRISALCNALKDAYVENVLKTYLLKKVAKYLVKLNGVDLLLGGTEAQVNFLAIKKHPDPFHFIKALAVLKNSGLLNGAKAQANFDAVKNHAESFDIAWALIVLKKAGLLSGDRAQANFDAVKKRRYPWSFAETLKELNYAGLLSGVNEQANFEVIDRWGVVSALKKLNKAGLLNDDGGQAIFEVIKEHRNPKDLAKALVILKEEGFLSGAKAQSIFQAVTEHVQPKDFALALEILKMDDLLSGDGAQANFEAVKEHRDPRKLALALRELKDANSLSWTQAQASFEAVKYHPEPFTLAARLEYAVATKNIDQMDQIFLEQFKSCLESPKYLQTSFLKTVYQSNTAAIKQLAKVILPSLANGIEKPEHQATAVQFFADTLEKYHHSSEELFLSYVRIVFQYNNQQVFPEELDARSLGKCVYEFLSSNQPLAYLDSLAKADEGKLKKAVIAHIKTLDPAYRLAICQLALFDTTNNLYIFFHVQRNNSSFKPSSIQELEKIFAESEQQIRVENKKAKPVAESSNAVETFFQSAASRFSSFFSASSDTASSSTSLSAASIASSSAAASKPFNSKDPEAAEKQYGFDL